MVGKGTVLGEEDDCVIRCMGEDVCRAQWFREHVEAVYCECAAIYNEFVHN
jgi:hypothetical protein